MKISDIKEILRARGIKHSWVARKINVSPAWFSMVINEKKKAPDGFIDNIIGAIKLK
tara:strand:+ start:30819 stop:30989 length:171 start_codon:yes stop_codon:yes gene_type:complete